MFIMLRPKMLSFVACFVAAIFLVPDSAFAVKTVGDLKKVESQVQELVSKTLPCTVCVRSARGQGSGSGVVVSKDGLVLTAAHVTQAAGQDLIVIFPDGRRVKAKSLGANRGRDGSMVQITEPGPYPFVEVGKSSELEQNEWCISLGHAGGFQADRSPPVRMGRVLSNGRFVVTDCTIIAGDSGGPLFDLDGRLIGIHSNIGESLSQNQHVPVDVFTEDWDRMKKGESWGAGLGGGGDGGDPRRLVLGVQLSPEPNDDGVVLGGVTENSPAERAGLKARDVITKINDTKVSSAQDIINVVRRQRAGDQVKVAVIRGDKTMDFDVRIVRAGQLSQRGGPQQQRRRPRRQRPPLDNGDQKDEPKEESKAEPKDQSADKKDAGSQPEDDKTESAKEESKQSDDKDEKENKEESKEEENKDRSIEELLRDARRSGGRLQLSAEEAQRLRKYMLERRGGQPGRNTQETDEWFVQVLEAYEPVVAIASDSTYRVLVDGSQVALGTAVSKNTLLTKASEIDELEFEVELAKGDLVNGEVVQMFSEYDLALIQISKKSLKPIKLSAKKRELSLGTFLASVGNGKEPEAIGLISVKTREFESAKGFLGVSLNDADDGILIQDVSPESPASRAGMKAGDLILKFEGKKYGDLPALIKAVGSHLPGEEVKMLVKRDGKKVTIKAKLGVRQADTRSRSARMNQMGSELSDTRTGFPLALQHDCPIEPGACGGPLVNLDGDVVGINIARAGRIKSYALPTDVIQKLLKQTKAEKELAK